MCQLYNYENVTWVAFRPLQDVPVPCDDSFSGALQRLAPVGMKNIVILEIVGVLMAMIAVIFGIASLCALPKRSWMHQMSARMKILRWFLYFSNKAIISAGLMMWMCSYDELFSPDPEDKFPAYGGSNLVAINVLAIVTLMIEGMFSSIVLATTNVLQSQYQIVNEQ